MPQQDHTGYVYFMSCPLNGFIRIGFSANSVALRFSRHRAASPVPLEPIGTIPGGRQAERDVHLRFASLWSHGEWFRGESPLVEWVAQNVPPWKGKMAPSRPLISAVHPPDQVRPETVKQWAERTLLTFRGETRTMMEWSELTGLGVRSLKRRVESGVIADNMFNRVEFQGKTVIMPDVPTRYFYRKDARTTCRRRPLQAMLDALKPPEPDAP